MGRVAHILLASLLVLCSLLVSGCGATKESAPMPTEEPKQVVATPEPTAVVEEFESFDEYVAALASLFKDYGLGDEGTLTGTGGLDTSDPYLTRRILLSTDQELPEGLGAARILHYGQEYVLQFRTREETERAYDSLKNSPLGEDVSLDIIVTADREQE